jgi:hypothetical protein
MDVEQGYLINLFTDEGMQGVEIISRPRKHSGEDSLSPTQVYFWMKEVKWESTDLSTIASPGGEPDEGLTAIIAGRLDADSYLSARKRAHSLGIALSTVCLYLVEVLGMKYRHLHRVPHTSMTSQKAVCAELAQGVQQALAKHEDTNFTFLFRDDESWVFSAYDYRPVRAASWDDVDGIEGPSHFQQKTMIAFFSMEQVPTRLRLCQKDNK